MSRTSNQVSTVAPDANTMAYANAARGYAQNAAGNIAAQPFYTGERTAGMNPFETQAMQQNQYLANQLPGAVQGFQNQASLFGQGAGYLDQNMQGGMAGQQALQAGLGQQGAGLGTVGNASSMFGAGAAGLQQAGAAINPYLQASQSLIGNGVPQALAGQQGQGQAAQDALQQYGMQAAQTGFGAAQGAFGQPDVSAFMNPYQQNVLDAVNQQFDRTRQSTLRTVGDQFQQAGAFGGSRQGVAEGSFLAANARDQNAALAGLTQQGYNDAQNRAMQQQQFQAQAGQSLFGQGLGALGQNAGFGQNALNSQVGLYGQGLNNLGNVAQNANSQLYSGGLGAGQFQAQFGQQNANSLFGAGNSAANQFANVGAQGNAALANLGLGGNAGINQYGQAARGVQQAGFDANRAAYEEPIIRQQQALQAYLASIGAPSGQTSTTPMTTNYLSQGLGLLGTVGGAFLGGPAGASLGGMFGSKIGNLGGADKTSNGMIR